MNNTVFIKLYRELRDPVWHDLCINREDEALRALKEFCSQRNIQCQFILIDDLPTESIGEILYENDLTEEQKEYFMQFLKEMNEDAEEEKNTFNVFSRPIIVYFYQMLKLQMLFR